MKKTLAALFASTMVLAACGGGSSDLTVTPTPPAPPVIPPASVGDTISSFIGYLMVLVTQTSDGEPLDVSAITPPLSETTEPSTLP